MTENTYNQEKLFSDTLETPRRTYFFDIKKTKEDSFYLVVTESRGGRKDKIMIFDEHIDEFASQMQKAVSFIQNNKPKS